MKNIDLFSERYCTYCGTQLEEGVSRCHCCDKDLDEYETIKNDYVVGELVNYKNEVRKVLDMKLMLHPASQLYEDAYLLEGNTGFVFWEELYFDNFVCGEKRNKIQNI